jgi:hypothetical protein
VVADGGEVYEVHDGAYIGDARLCGSCADVAESRENWVQNKTLRCCTACGEDLVLELARSVRWCGLTLKNRVSLCDICFRNLIPHQP